jgi:glycosyltransferase involved in cell wall biosynthesis
MISVLLPIYNGERFLRESIQSVLNQTFTEFELLIGFNGTVDSSKDIVNSFDDVRIRVFDYGDDVGKAKTLNKLITESKYDWIALQDDDDIWVESKLETQIQYFEQVDVVGTFIKYIDERGEFIGGPNLSHDHETICKLSLMGNNQIANSSSVFKKSKAISIGGWDVSIDGIEDFDFWLRLIRSGNLFVNIPQYLVNHRLHSNSNFNTKKHDLTKILYNTSHPINI